MSEEDQGDISLEGASEPDRPFMPGASDPDCTRVVGGLNTGLQVQRWHVA